MQEFNSNIDFINFFSKISKLKLTENIFKNIIKFDDASEVWKQFTGNSNNLIVFFNELNLSHKITFIRYLEYYLLTYEQKIVLLDEKCKIIFTKLEIFFNKDNSNSLTNIDIYNMFHVVYGKFNEENVIIDLEFSYQYIEEKQNLKIENILTYIYEWYGNFVSNLNNKYPKLAEKYKPSIEILDNGDVTIGYAQELLHVVDDNITLSKVIDSDLVVDINAGKQFYESQNKTSL